MVGPHGLVTDAATLAPYLIDWRRRYCGRAFAMVRPASTTEVAEVVRLCAATHTAIVPQGGNTGLAGGATPDTSGTQILLSLSRMNRVRAVDPLNNTLTVDAGCTLVAVQEAARAADRLFPLSLAAEGSCEIGGNLSTNAGGTAVLRYGNARELTLGLEVVLASGEIWDGLRGLRKDNTGYDLKQLFIGAEGTLGIITAVVLKLFPLPRRWATGIVGVDSPAGALALLSDARERFGERLSSFELFSDFCLDLVLRHFADGRAPLRARHPFYVLIELTDSHPSADVRTALEDGLAAALAAALVRDAVIAASEAQTREMWALRERISDAQAREGKNVKHDVSLPASALAEFIATTGPALERVYPGVRVVCFGHLGDGNLHYNVSSPVGVDADAFLVNQEPINRIVHDSVAHFHGSISAEHGVGQLRRSEILRYKSPIEMALMRRLKAALDPRGIMNPGKLIAGADE
ncbi:MAG: FAD-binding oxidoreductase [Candidatus Binatia bacterium]